MSTAAASACVSGATFVEQLQKAGFDFFTGVPCSYLEAPIACLEKSPGGYLAATREDEAMSIAAGAWMGGKKLPVVFMQNSGLGNCLNVIASLHQSYEIPVLLVVSWRGHFGKDAPEHIMMGAVMPDLLNLFKVENERLDLKDSKKQLEKLARSLSEKPRAVALFVDKGELV
jgi:sulfopyruvate decarboxylase subunit alpha